MKDPHRATIVAIAWVALGCAADRSRSTTSGSAVVDEVGVDASTSTVVADASVAETTNDAGGEDAFDAAPKGPPPSPRSKHAMAYDASRKRVVLYGGGGNCGIFCADTWEWDGATWHALVPSESPGSRDSKMAYDAKGKRVILFGGWGVATNKSASTRS